MYSGRRFREPSAVTPDLLPEVLADHLDRLYRAAWAMCGSREDAEDLVQETFARVLAKRRTIASDADALPYLMRVLRNTFVSSLRTRSRRPKTAPLEDAEPRLAASASSSPAAVMAAREVFAAIAALPEDQRDVVAAVDVAGLSYAEAASTLGVPTGTVMSRLYRGRARVADAVGAWRSAGQALGSATRAAASQTAGIEQQGVGVRNAHNVRTSAEKGPPPDVMGSPRRQ